MIQSSFFSFSFSVFETGLYCMLASLTMHLGSLNCFTSTARLLPPAYSPVTGDQTPTLQVRALLSMKIFACALSEWDDCRRLVYTRKASSL